MFLNDSRKNYVMLTDQFEGLSPSDVDGVVERRAAALPEDVDVDKLDQLVDEVFARGKSFAVRNQPESESVFK